MTRLLVDFYVKNILCMVGKAKDEANTASLDHLARAKAHTPSISSNPCSAEIDTRIGADIASKTEAEVLRTVVLTREDAAAADG